MAIDREVIGFLQRIEAAEAAANGACGPNWGVLNLADWLAEYKSGEPCVLWPELIRRQCAGSHIPTDDLLSPYGKNGKRAELLAEIFGAKYTPTIEEAETGAKVLPNVEEQGFEIQFERGLPVRVKFSKEATNQQEIFAKVVELIADNPEIIRELDLRGCEGVTDISPLSRLTLLKSLDLSSCPVTDLAPLSHLTGLQSLNLYRCDQITDEKLREFVSSPRSRLNPGLAIDLPSGGEISLSKLRDQFNRREGRH